MEESQKYRVTSKVPPPSRHLSPSAKKSHTPPTPSAANVGNFFNFRGKRGATVTGDGGKAQSMIIAREVNEESTAQFREGILLT